MRIYRSDKNGIGIWRLAGVVGADDAKGIVLSLRASTERGSGCFILDFAAVKHVDYRAFGILEEGFPEGANVLLSGLSDYILDILAFVMGRRPLAIFPDWRRAMRYLTVERGKLGSPLPAGSGRIG